MSEKGIDEVILYIEKHLEEHESWLPKWREKYLSICNFYRKFGYISEAQKEVLIIAYSEIFDKVSPFDNMPDLPFSE